MVTENQGNGAVFFPAIEGQQNLKQIHNIIQLYISGKTLKKISYVNKNNPRWVVVKYDIISKAPESFFFPCADIILIKLSKL